MMRVLALVLGLIVAPLGAGAKITCDDGSGKICVEAVRSDTGLAFYGLNRFEALPVTLSVTFETENLTPDRRNAPVTVLDGGARAFIAGFRFPQGAGWSYTFRFDWSRGDITAVHDDGHVYALPFAAGRGYRVTQGCEANFTHKGPQRFATDFDMPIGTPVHAARAGRVVFVRQSSIRGGPTEDYRSDANSIVIEHADRTLARYYHLKAGGARVRVGQTVRAGQMIGLSGNTGMSTLPHLHFDVIKGAVGTESQTVPVTFRAARGPVVCPSRGEVYRAPQ